MNLSCPIPEGFPDRITAAHGGGGRMTHTLIRTLFQPAFESELLSQEHDGSVTPAHTGTLAVTTDGYVVKPMFFPGGDIGALAVNGSVNDLAMCGARPALLTVSFILEEGLRTEELARVLASMKQAKNACGITIAAGDTKVVEKGRGDGIYIATSGIGYVETPDPVGPIQIRAGDVILVSGDVGRHAAAVMSARDNLEFDEPVKSDCAPLWSVVEDLIAGGIPLHCMRDLTRGGLATALVELAVSSGRCFRVHGPSVPVLSQVRGVCEMLGLDALYMACEGRFIVLTEERFADRALQILRKHQTSAGAAVIGRVDAETAAEHQGRVFLKTELGTERYLDMLSGEQLPRIC